MDITKPKQYTRTVYQVKKEIPTAKGGVEVSYPFQWMLFRPQLHAIAPFEYNQASRNENTQRGNEKR